MPLQSAVSSGGGASGGGTYMSAPASGPLTPMASAGPYVGSQAHSAAAASSGAKNDSLFMARLFLAFISNRLKKASHAAKVAVLYFRGYLLL